MLIKRQRGETERNIDMEIFHLLVDTAKTYSNWGKARLKPGAQNSVWVSEVGGRSPCTWAISLWHPGTSSGGWMGSIGRLGLKSGTPIWNMGVASGILTHFATTPHPYMACLKGVK